MGALEVMQPVMLRAVEIAERETGQRESDGPNDSPRIREYLKLCGIHEPAPYCAAFLCWCIEQARKELGLEKPIRYNAYCPTLVKQFAPIFSKHTTPKRGDIFAVWYPNLDGGRFGHIGILKSDLDYKTQTFGTVEGNTGGGTGSDGIVRDGDGVWSKRRVNSPNILFFRLP